MHSTMALVTLLSLESGALFVHVVTVKNHCPSKSPLSFSLTKGGFLEMRMLGCLGIRLVSFFVFLFFFG